MDFEEILQAKEEGKKPKIHAILLDKEGKKSFYTGFVEKAYVATEEWLTLIPFVGFDDATLTYGESRPGFLGMSLEYKNIFHLTCDIDLHMGLSTDFLNKDKTEEIKAFQKYMEIAKKLTS